MSRNPDWTRDELILALDLYFRAGKKQLDASHPEILQLSKLLNQLPIHSQELRGSDFRNAQGVSMKLGNLLAVDPDHKGAGLKRGSRLDKEVWDEFSNDPDRLRMLAATIARSVSPVRDVPSENFSVEPDDEDEFPEGRILTRLHKYKERRSEAAKKKKRKVLREAGKLACEACNFDFVEFYGPLGQGFAECHHLTPIANLEPGHRTRLEDLAIVCSNCHRILHKSRPMMGVSQLRELIMSRRKGL
jgi:5-methylcytosine-specific restriction protein A